MRIVERWRRGEETRTCVSTGKSLSVEVKGCSFECTSHMLPSLNTDKSCWLRLVKPVQCVLEPPCIFLRQEICPESSTHCAETCSHHCTPSSRHMINGRPGKIQQKSLESPWSTVLYGSKQLVNSILVWKEKTVTLTVAYSTNPLAWKTIGPITVTTHICIIIVVCSDAKWTCFNEQCFFLGLV